MSRLESFIRRMQAQVACIDQAAEMAKDIPGVVFELGLGNGRTYDHVRERFADRDVYAFENDVRAHPDSMPEEEFLIVGEIEDTLPRMVERFRGQVAVLHTDLGSTDPEENERLAQYVTETMRPGLREGAIVVSERGLSSPYLTQVKVNADIHPKRYHIYTYSAQGAEAGDGSHEADAMTGG